MPDVFAFSTIPTNGVLTFSFLWIFSQDNLAAFYRDSAVALVTPLRDGMNLVAKEFVACQINETGVLILSPFAGAGGTMREALLVNPYEVDMVSETIHKALIMDEDERRWRMQQLRKRESSMDVDHWMASFLAEMDRVECAITAPPSSIPVDYGYQSYLSEYIEDSTKLNLLLDYDGTLAPIVSHPDLALMSAETRRVLTHLSRMPSVSVCVMSGRTLENLRQMVNIDGITYAGSQGLEILHPDGMFIIKIQLHVADGWIMIYNLAHRIAFHSPSTYRPSNPIAESATRSRSMFWLTNDFSFFINIFIRLIINFLCNRRRFALMEHG